MDNTIFREHLRHLLQTRNLSMKAFGEELNVTPAALSRYLSVDRTPDLPYIVKIASYFSVSIDRLLGLNGDKYDIMPVEVQEIADLYQMASPQDRRVVQAVLDKYKERK